MTNGLEQLTRNLARLATHYDIEGAWPERSLEHFTAADVWGWAIPTEFGGMGLDARTKLIGYEAVAAGCMTCALILTQRDGACEFISECENQDTKALLLSGLARNKLMTSIGISHLTTSRHGAKAALQATADNNEFLLSGFVPWVTGASRCQGIVTAASVTGGGQILIWLPLDRPGVHVDPPMRLAALEGSLTSEVHCRAVRIDAGLVLRGPTQDALRRRSPVKSLVVAATGIGLARSLARDIQAHAEREDGPIRELAEEAVERCAALRERLQIHADQMSNPEADIPKTEIRAAVNDLLVRMAASAVTIGKGSGFIRQRDTQRLAREALFFLVWSATNDVRTKTLSKLLEQAPPETRSMGY